MANLIDKEEIRTELIRKNLFQMQVDLTRQRRLRILVMSLLMASLMLTVVYGTLENPFQYTFSNIGNFFDYRIFFIVWAIVSGLAIQVSIVALFRLENYKAKSSYLFVGLAAFFLVLTSLIPALKDIYPFWHWLHTACAIVFALFMLLSLIPYVLFISRENPRLRLVLKLWMVVIWIGSLFPLILFGTSGLFELWFFVSLIIWLLYLSLVLFEEKIVKLSVAFLKDEPNLDLAIEKLYVNLQINPKKDRQD